MMESFPSQKVLLRAYWPKLTSSIGAGYKSEGRVSAGRGTRVLQTRHRSGPAQRSGYPDGRVAQSSSGH